MPLSPSLLAPPLVGAFIGYMTNHIAIRMLFRPLKPWRLFGLRLPLTPGVIPAKRHELAVNIGEMVGSHLLTSADIKRALGEEGFQAELDILVQAKVTDLLHRDLGPLPSLVPEKFRSYFQAGVKILRWRTLKLLHAHLDSDLFAENILPTVIRGLDDLLARKAEAFLTPGDRQRLFAFLRESLGKFFADEQTEIAVKETIAGLFRKIAEENLSLTDLLSAEIRDLIVEVVEQEAPELLQKIAVLLQDAEARRKVARGLAGAAGSFISSMGPMAAMIGAFLDPDAIAEKIEVYLAEHADEFSDMLFNEEVRSRVTAVLSERLKKAMDSPLSGLLNKMPEQKRHLVEDKISTLVLAALRSPATTEKIVRLLEERLQNVNDKPLSDILQAVFGAARLEDGKRWVADELLAILRSSRVRHLIDELIIELAENRLLNQPIGTLESLLPKEVQNSIGSYLVEQLSDILIREVPPLVDSLDIGRMVARKVDSLDLLRLESLLLSIMQEQFKYINLFGGLLGFIIGLANLFFILS
ncbi:MAG: DUF445 family protein [Deltaproteobacteria bacterium]